MPYAAIEVSSWPVSRIRYYVSQVELTGALMNAKNAVRELLDRLPDDCSLEDVLYPLYVLREIEPGRADVVAGRVI
jgi:hypothetical protein